MKNKVYPWFWCHRSQMWPDSWTYGDWKQFICNRPGGQTQCAKLSGIFGIVYFLLLVLVVGLGFIGVINLTVGVPIYPLRVLLIGGTAFVLLVSMTIRFLLGWRLMHAVGPMNEGARRILPWDHPEKST